MQEKIIAILNSAIPQPEYSDYINFLQEYAGLTQMEKIMYLDTAFKPPRIFLEKMAFFLKHCSGLKRASIAKKLQFAAFLKTINDLCFNNPLLLNLKGDVKDTWIHYGFHPFSDSNNYDFNTENMLNVVLDLIQKSGLTIQTPSLIKTQGLVKFFVADSIGKEFQEGVSMLIKELGDNVSQPLFVNNEKVMCMLFMLNQSKFVGHCISLSCTSVDLNGLYSLWDIRLKLVKLCAIHRENFQVLLHANVALVDLARLANIGLELFILLLQNTLIIKPLIVDEWLVMENLLSFAKKCPKICKTYLENPQQLACFKTANVPFSVLIRGDAYANCYRTAEIIYALTQRSNFNHLISHSKAAEVFSRDLKNGPQSNAAFISACVRNEIFRMLIHEPDKIHRLLDRGFVLEPLCKQAINLKTILDRIEDVFDLLSKAIPIQIFINWFWKELSLVDLIEHAVQLLHLKTLGIELIHFATLSNTHPDHAVLILKNPNHPHSEWWVKQQLKKQSNEKPSKPLSRVQGKYRIVFDLDRTTISRIKNLNDAWVCEFKQKGLYVDIPNLADPYIIHPGFIECLRWLYHQGIEIGICSAGDVARNKPVVQRICTIAFQSLLNSGSYQTVFLFSRENMQGSPYKNLEFFLREGEDIHQTVLIDDDVQFRHPEQHANFVEICPATDETFKNVYKTKPAHTVLHAANHIYCLTGAIAKAIKIAENTGCTLSAAFKQIVNRSAPNYPSSSVNSKDTYTPTTLFQYQTHYLNGLKILKRFIDPKLQLATPGNIFSADYTLFPQCNK